MERIGFCCCVVQLEHSLFAAGANTETQWTMWNMFSKNWERKKSILNHDADQRTLHRKNINRFTVHLVDELHNLIIMQNLKRFPCVMESSFCPATTWSRARVNFIVSITQLSAFMCFPTHISFYSICFIGMLFFGVCLTHFFFGLTDLYAKQSEFTLSTQPNFCTSQLRVPLILFTHVMCVENICVVFVVAIVLPLACSLWLDFDFEKRTLFVHLSSTVLSVLILLFVLCV